MTNKTRKRWTGLSVKKLGRKKYDNAYDRATGAFKGIKPRWTGLSDKMLGHTIYIAKYRVMAALRKKHATETPTDL